MAIVFALLCAAAYGVSDFLGGIFARRLSAWSVAVVGQSSSTVCTLVVAIPVGGTVTASDWRWSAAAGLATGVGTAFLYRGFAAGRLSVVAPISALGSAVVPVTVGLLTGDRPPLLAWVGIICALPAIYLISRITGTVEDARQGTSRGIVDGVIAGLGFGGMFAVLGQVGEDAGLYPLTLTLAVSVLAVVLCATALREAWLPRSRDEARSLLMGPLGALATGAFLYATHTGLLAIVSVIAALYPALTVLLAATVLREHIHRAQAYGLVLAAVAVSLVAVG